MGRPSRRSAQKYSFTSESGDSQSSIDAESVVKNERVYLHIYDYEAREYTGLTTYHGMVRIYNSTTWPSRIFWCVVVVSCLSLFMIHSGIMLYSYHLKPTLTQVTVVVPDGGIPLPEITVCGFSPVVESKLESWNMSDTVLTYLLEAYGIEASEKDPVFQKEFISYKENYRNIHNRTFDVKEFFEKTGPECEDLIKICYFSGKLIENCCSLTKTIMTDYGKCVIFQNVNKTRKQWFSGFHHGMEIIMDSNSKFASRLPLDPFVGVGARVYLHEEDEIPQIKSNGISVPPGMTLYGGMSVQQISLLPKTNWGRCQPGWDTDIHGENFLNRNYSAIHCEINCKINLMLEKCGCVPVSLAVEKNMKVCDLEIEKTCFKTEFSKKCNCSVECEKTQYITQVSYSNIKFSQEEKKIIGENEINYAKENYVGILLYMKEMNYEHHEQQRQVQTADLLSNIAGSMGLFLGMSTITLLEIFIFLFKSIWGTVNTERQKQFVKSIIQQEEGEKNTIILPEDQKSEDQESLVHSDTEDTFKDPEFCEFKPIQENTRKTSIFSRNFPRKSLVITIDKEDQASGIRRLSGSRERRTSMPFQNLMDFSKIRKTSHQHHAITMDTPGFSRRDSTRPEFFRRDSSRPEPLFHRLSVNSSRAHERRPSATELFRAARRPSIIPQASTAIRRKSVNLQPKEIHLQIIRRPSANAIIGFQPTHNPSIRRNSTYNVSLV
ncbi:hypothetical protein FO519_008973 [Halicephalobus sp. NKZ332]|nr:hypothetical protein FO519_008973 [Halicephalobus sp. NKZ332]